MEDPNVIFGVPVEESDAAIRYTLCTAEQEQKVLDFWTEQDPLDRTVERAVAALGMRPSVVGRIWKERLGGYYTDLFTGDKSNLYASVIDIKTPVTFDEAVEMVKRLENFWGYFARLTDPAGQHEVLARALREWSLASLEGREDIAGHIARWIQWKMAGSPQGAGA